MDPLVLAASQIRPGDVTRSTVAAWREVLRALIRHVGDGCDQLGHAGMAPERLRQAYGWVRLAQVELAREVGHAQVEKRVREGYKILLRLSRTRRRVPTCARPAERLLRRVSA